MTTAPDISIVVPLFNEEACVQALFERIHGEAEKLGRSYEVVFVDDGSRDRTFAVCETIAARHPELRVVKFRRNAGQTAAMAAGFEKAKGQIIITMDGDLQNDPSDMTRLLAKMDEGFDVVSGWRYDRQDAFITRTLPSRVANWLISTLTGVRLHDYGCCLKAYRARFLKRLHFYSDMHRFFPAIVASLSGARTAEIPVTHHPRTTGKSKYGLSRIFLVLADLGAILMLTRFIRKPVYWFALLGLPFFALGTALLVLTVVFASDTAARLGVIPALAFMVLAVAFHFLMNGVLAEYIVSTGETDLRKLVAVPIRPLGGNHAE